MDQQVALPLRYHKNATVCSGLYGLLCFWGPSPSPHCWMSAPWLSLGSFAPRKWGEEGEEKERLERKGERKSSEWHHNITMQWWAQLANTAGPATVKRLMSPNSKQSLKLCFYSIITSLIHRNTHTHFGFLAFTHMCLQNSRAIITCKY